MQQRDLLSIVSANFDLVDSISSGVGWPVTLMIFSSWFIVLAGREWQSVRSVRKGRWRQGGG